MESKRTHGTPQGRAKAGNTKAANTKRALVAKLIEVVDTEYRRTGSGMGIRPSHLKKVASPPTIRKHFPSGIPEIAAEAVRVLTASELPINPHLDALASMLLDASPANTHTVLMGLRLSRVPTNPFNWSQVDLEEVQSLLENIDNPSLPPNERARLNYLAAQQHTKLAWDRLYPSAHTRRFPTPPSKELQGSDQTAHYLENARDLYLRCGEYQGALLAHIELRSHRIFNITGNPTLADIHSLHRDCIAMRGADLHLAASVWLRLQESLHARTLGFTDAPIHDIFVEALAGFKDAPIQDFRTYPMDEIRKIFLLASQAGAVTADLAKDIPKEAIYAIGISWLSAVGGESLAPRGDTLSPASLVLLRNAGIAQTYARTREFRLLLQTHLGLTTAAVEAAFVKLGLDRFEDTRDPVKTAQADTALDLLWEAVEHLLAAPQARNSWRVQDAIKDLRILQDDWDVTMKHRGPFEPRAILPLTGDDAKDSIASWLWGRKQIQSAVYEARHDRHRQWLQAALGWDNPTLPPADPTP